MYAIFLASMHSFSGIMTDEAKYLLNIPYPHPPLMRWIMSQTEALAFQEFFWRILLATLLVQSVFLIWIAARKLSTLQREVLCGMWLISFPLFSQAGSIMMAPITALQGLIFVLLVLKKDIRKEWAPWIALFWLLSLFTAYQAVLFLPLVFVILRRAKCRFADQVVLLFGPLLVLILYTFTNPLAASSFLNAGTQNAGVDLHESATGALWLWAIGGSLALSILGTLGMMRLRSFSLLVSLLLVFLFILISHRSYYAILFLPLFIGGVITSPNILRWPRFFLIVCVIFTVSMITYPLAPSSARRTLDVIADMNINGDLLIEGSFGHEWQYEIQNPIRRYSPEFLSDAGAVVCLHGCMEMEKVKGWERLSELDVSVYVREDSM